MDSKHTPGEVWESEDDAPIESAPKRYCFSLICFDPFLRPRQTPVDGSSTLRVSVVLREMAADKISEIENLRRPTPGGQSLSPISWGEDRPFTPCCEDVIEIPRVVEYFSEIHPSKFYLIKASQWPSFFDDGKEGCKELSRIIRSLIGCHYYLSEIVLFYLEPEETIQMLSPLFGAYGCSHYDSIPFGMSCIITEREQGSNAPQIRYTRPVLRHASLFYSLTNLLVARYEHYKLIVAALESHRANLRRSFSVINERDETSWIYPRGMSLDARSQFLSFQTRTLRRNRKAWTYIQNFCLEPWITTTRLLDGVRGLTRIPIRVAAMHQIRRILIEVIIADAGAQLDPHASGVKDPFDPFTNWRSGVPSANPAAMVSPKDLADILQHTYTVFPQFRSVYCYDNYMMPDKDIRELGSNYALMRFAVDFRLNQSPSYEPTSPSYSPAPYPEKKEANPLIVLDADPSHSYSPTYSPGRGVGTGTDVGDAVFRQQLEDAIKLSLDEQKERGQTFDTGVIIEVSSKPKRECIVLSDTETDEDIQLAQSQSLDPPEEFAHLFCHEALPVDSDDEPLVSPKTSRRIEEQVAYAKAQEMQFDIDGSFLTLAEIKKREAKRAKRKRRANLEGDRALDRLERAMAEAAECDFVLRQSQI